MNFGLLDDDLLDFATVDVVRTGMKNGGNGVEAIARAREGRVGDERRDANVLYFFIHSTSFQPSSSPARTPPYLLLLPSFFS